jgi:hypothetical protein
MKILLGDLNSKVGREGIFKPTIGNESLHEISNDNGVRIVNFATSKKPIVKSTMFTHRSIHKYTWTSPDGNTHNQKHPVYLLCGLVFSVPEVSGSISSATRFSEN